MSKKLYEESSIQDIATAIRVSLICTDASAVIATINEPIT